MVNVTIYTIHTDPMGNISKSGKYWGNILEYDGIWEHLEAFTYELIIREQKNHSESQ